MGQALEPPVGTFTLAIGGQGNPLGGQDFTQALEDTIARRVGRAEGEELTERAVIQRGPKSHGEQGLWLGAEEKPIALPGIVERLDTQAIPGQKEALAIPECQGEDAVDFTKEVRAITHQAGQQIFHGHIVYRAVEDKNALALALPAAQGDSGFIITGGSQPGLRQADRAVLIYAAAIRPAMLQRIGRPMQDTAAGILIYRNVVEGVEARDSAHRLPSCFLRDAQVCVPCKFTPKSAAAVHRASRPPVSPAGARASSPGSSAF